MKTRKTVNTSGDNVKVREALKCGEETIETIKSEEAVVTKAGGEDAVRFQAPLYTPVPTFYPSFPPQFTVPASQYPQLWQMPPHNLPPLSSAAPVQHSFSPYHYQVPSYPQLPLGVPQFLQTQTLVPHPVPGNYGQIEGIKHQAPHATGSQHQAHGLFPQSPQQDLVPPSVAHKPKTQPKDSSPSPHGWERIRSKTHGLDYYYNKSTHVTQWTKPDELKVKSFLNSTFIYFNLL